MIRAITRHASGQPCDAGSLRVWPEQASTSAWLRDACYAPRKKQAGNIRAIVSNQDSAVRTDEAVRPATPVSGNEVGGARPERRVVHGCDAAHIHRHHPLVGIEAHQTKRGRADLEADTGFLRQVNQFLQ